MPWQPGKWLNMGLLELNLPFGEATQASDTEMLGQWPQLGVLQDKQESITSVFP